MQICGRYLLKSKAPFTRRAYQALMGQGEKTVPTATLLNLTRSPQRDGLSSVFVYTSVPHQFKEMTHLQRLPIPGEHRSVNEMGQRGLKD